jgi:flagellar L-ring protein FlgH
MTTRLPVAVLSVLIWFMPGMADDLVVNSGWSSLATDRNAHRIGDILTIVVYENATASNSANSNVAKTSAIHGQVQADASFNHSASVGAGSTSDNTGTTTRSGQMVAQISAVVEEVLPNGDLKVSGSQILNINGERTNIRVRGRVRDADIAADNTVLSSRLADATIDYDGQGFVSRSSRPGIITTIFNWLEIP